jgi:hypothetical protein
MLSVANSVILTRALVELNAAQAGDVVQPDLLQLALDTENQILDEWNSEREKVYADSFLPFTLTPNLNPHTIGPVAPAGATWTTTQAPIKINGIKVAVSTTSPVSYRFCTPRDAAWFQALVTPGLTADVPTDFFFDPTWTTTAPFGSVYFYPVPTVAHAVQLWCRIVLGQLTMNQTISLPPGYNRALMLSTAKALSAPLRKQWSTLQEQQLIKALRQIASNNTVVPRIRTLDSGMPRGNGSGLPNFMWPDGSLTGR